MSSLGFRIVDHLLVHRRIYDLRCVKQQWFCIGVVSMVASSTNNIHNWKSHSGGCNPISFLSGYKKFHSLTWKACLRVHHVVVVDSHLFKNHIDFDLLGLVRVDPRLLYFTHIHKVPYTHACNIGWSFSNWNAWLQGTYFLSHVGGPPTSHGSAWATKF